MGPGLKPVEVSVQLSQVDIMIELSSSQVLLVEGHIEGLEANVSSDYPPRSSLTVIS